MWPTPTSGRTSRTSSSIWSADVGLGRAPGRFAGSANGRSDWPVHAERGNRIVRNFRQADRRRGGTSHVLYELHEWRRKILTPFSTWAQATSQLFSNPYSPLSYTVYSRRLAASYDLLYRLGKHYEKPAFGIHS